MMQMAAQKGFSMVEMLVATTVFMIVTAGVMTLVSGTHRSYHNERTDSETISRGRAAQDLIVRDLRMAGYPARNTYEAGAGLTPENSNLVSSTFVVASSTVVAFDADLDGNGVVERVEYRLNGSTLERSDVPKNNDGSLAAPQYQPLVSDVVNGSSAVFSYTTDPYSSEVWPKNVNSVRVTLLLRSPAPDPKTRQFRTHRFYGVAYRANPDR